MASESIKIPVWMMDLLEDKIMERDPPYIFGKHFSADTSRPD
jgi:hypothetical protein